MLEKLRNLIKNKLSCLIVFSVVYIYLFYIFKPSLIFLDTTVSGGDTGSHNYIVYYLKKIFPSIHGWSHDWYAGFPFLYFYPPLLYIFTVILSCLIPVNIAFKIITILGTLFLPLSCFLCLKILNFKKPVPEVSVLLSLVFLFLESYNIYGGNIPSTLAGEFSYSFSFSLFWIFVATLKKGIENSKHIVLNTVILSLMVLSHPIPVITSILSIPFLVFGRGFKPRFLYVLKIYIFAFVLTSFWSVPFLLYFDYTSGMRWHRYIRVSDIFPPSIILFQIIAFAGIIYAFIKRQKNILLFVFISIAALIPYFLLDNSKIWNTRFLPFFTMSLLLISACFVGIFFRKINFSISVPVLAFIVVFWVDKNLNYIPQWVKWNYEGFEKKENWIELKPLFNYLKTLPYGRIMWEYTPEYSKFGSPRVLELIPLFSQKPTMEGLLIESAVSSPFHFMLQAETTLTPTTPFYGFKYPEFNMKKAITHMKILGVRYFVAYTEKIKKETDKFLPKIAAVGKFAVYEVPDVALIEPVFDFYVEKKDKRWIFKSIEWFKDGELLKPIVFVNKDSILKQLFNKKKVNCVMLNFEKNLIEFYTNGIGIPHIIKVSYFPKWKVEGAEGPYIVSPSFMLVIPESSYVKLFFR